jgi:hypothetical protein
MVVRVRSWVAWLGLAVAQPLAAQGAVDAPVEPPAPVLLLQAPASPVAHGPIIPALTPITLQMDAAISSKTAKRGDRFGLTMVGDIMVDGVIVVPRGARGEGEVIHSAGVGFGGRAGELIVAARFLRVGDEKLPLQSFRIFKAGANNTAEAIGLMAAAGAVGAVAALFVTGTSAEIGAGQFATAKTAKAFALPTPQTSSTGETKTK